MAEKTAGPRSFADNASEQFDAPLPWTWRENTVIRVYEAWEFCLTNKLPSRLGGSGDEKKTDSERGMAFEGMEKVFAAVGLGGSAPPPARRGILSGELFASPEPHDENSGTGIVEETRVTPPPSAQIREKKATLLVFPVLSRSYLIPLQLPQHRFHLLTVFHSPHHQHRQNKGSTQETQAVVRGNMQKVKTS